MCLSYADLIPDLGHKYVNILHNNVTQTFSVAMHVVMVDIHTLLEYPCQMLFDTHDYHA